MPLEPVGHFRYFIAFGSNEGARLRTITSALRSLCAIGEIDATSNLYETEPLYEASQPVFLNGVVALQTDREPFELLSELQRIEKDHGRERSTDTEKRFGPRTLDLDVLLAERWQPNGFRGLPPVTSSRLTIPHPRIKERSFVLRPLKDLGISVRDARPLPGRVQQVLVTANEMVLPVRRCAAGMPHVMGILNVTPDSFSDGHPDNLSMEKALRTAERLVRHGARLLDVGGQSTRPGAVRISPAEEAARILPVLKALRARFPAQKGIWISVDTCYASVAKLAIEHGADCINDVSSGRLDPGMLPFLAEAHVPAIFMHMRGNPQTMMDHANYPEGEVVDVVASELAERLDAAQRAGIYRFNLIADPGLGFAKHSNHNIALLRGLERFRELLSRGRGEWPMLLGVSRKRFLEQFAARSATLPDAAATTSGKEAQKDNSVPLDAAARDFATAGAVTWAALHDVDIVRVHEPAVCDAARCFLYLQRDAASRSAAASTENETCAPY
jgi:dihydropteroate synthase/2-amino-4-hydroxy-6-hydroxymethyldihydropteridine diphosphokinase